MYKCSVCEQECENVRDHLVTEHIDILGYFIKSINVMTDEELIPRMVVYGFKFTEVTPST